MNTPSLFCASVLYPHTPDAAFDFDLYAGILAPEFARLLGNNCLRFEVRKGLQAPGSPYPAFICIANFWIQNPTQFGAAMDNSEMKELMGRIAAFTTIQPIRQFEQVL